MDQHEDVTEPMEIDPSEKRKRRCCNKLKVRRLSCTQTKTSEEGICTYRKGNQLLKTTLHFLLKLYK